MAYIDPKGMVDFYPRTEYNDDTLSFIDRELRKAAERRKNYTLSASQEERREALKRQLGFPLSPSPEKNEITVTKEFAAQGENFTAYRMRLEVIEGVRLYGILLEPKVKKEKNALVIAQHGGQGTPEMITSLVPPTNYYSVAMDCCRDGVYVFAPQLLHWSTENWGSPYNGAGIDIHLRQLGGGKTAFGVYCIMRAIDYFTALPEIDADRVGMVGLSYGGMYTLMTTAVDPRIKVAVSSCFVNDRARYAWDDWSYKNQANTFFDAEVLTLIAPRHILVEEGDNDNLFAADTFLQQKEQLEVYKKALSLPDFCEFCLFPGGHQFCTDGANVDYLFRYL